MNIALVYINIMSQLTPIQFVSLAITPARSAAALLIQSVYFVRKMASVN